MPVHMPSTLGTRRGLMPHIDEACRVHTHDVVQHTPATQRGPALPSRHPQIYRQTRTFLERTGSLQSQVQFPGTDFLKKCVPLLSGCPRRRHTAAIGVVLRARYAPTRWLHTTSSPGGVARSSVIAAPICSKCPHCVGGGEPGRAHLVGRGDADRALVWLGVCVVAT